MKFAWLVSALVYCLLFPPGTAQAQRSQTSPFDGMSAIEIKVAAALRDKPEASSGQSTRLEFPATTASGFGFLRCDLVELKGHPLHPGEFPIPGEPLPGTALARVEFNQYAQDVEFWLTNESGGQLRLIDLGPPGNQSASTTFQGSFTVPNEPFRIAATGEDLENQPFDVSCDRLYSPQSVELRIDPENAMVSAGEYELTAVITNHGTTNTFVIDASSDLGIDVNPSQPSIVLGPDESAPITLSLTIPLIASGVLDIGVIVSATAEGNPNITNQAGAVLWVERFEAVFGDDFE